MCLWASKDLICSPRNIQFHGAKVTPSGIRTGIEGCKKKKNTVFKFFTLYGVNSTHTHTNIQYTYKYIPKDNMALGANSVRNYLTGIKSRCCLISDNNTSPNP